jgi:hypothetical protein
LTSKQKQQKAERKELGPEEQMRRLEELERRILLEEWPERKIEIDQVMRLFFTNPKKLREWRRKTIAGIRRYSKRDKTVPSSWASKTIAGIDAFYKKLMRELTRARKELIQP